MSQQSSKPKHKYKRMTLSWKLNSLFIAVILVVSFGVFGIGTYAYTQRVDMVFQSLINSSTENIVIRLDMDAAKEYAKVLVGDEFAAVKRYAVAERDDNAIREWLRQQPASHLPVITKAEDAEGPFNLYQAYEALEQYVQDYIGPEELSRVEVSYLTDEWEIVLYDSSLGMSGLGRYTEEEHPEEGLDQDKVYGWELSGFSEIMNNSSDFPGGLYVFGYISMNNSVVARSWFIINTVICIVVFIGMITLMSIYLTRRYVTNPIQHLIEETAKFTRGKGAYTRANVIETDGFYNDEISDLSEEVKTMQTKIIDYMEYTERQTKDRERINTEIRLAAEIQHEMLPDLTSEFRESSDFEIFGTMIPAREVGGDFYDFFFIDETHLALVIADVSGKGIPASLYMMVSMILIRNEAMSGNSPAEVFEGVNRQICDFNKLAMFVTVWLGIVDLETGTMVCSNAGHELPAIRRKGSVFRLLPDDHSLVLGGLPGTEYREYEVKLNPGDMVFVYTDGVTEAHNHVKDLFTEKRLIQTLNNANAEHPKEIIDAVYRGINDFTMGAVQFDDITMLCFRYLKGKDKS